MFEFCPLEREKDKSIIQSLKTGFLAVSKTGDISNKNKIANLYGMTIIIFWIYGGVPEMRS